MIAAPTHRLVTAGLAASILAAGLFLASGPEGQAQETRKRRAVPSGRATGPVSYADILEPALEAVVHVDAKRTGSSPRRESAFPWFFESDEEKAPEPRGESQGSGVIVRSDGIILTNSHVVQGASRVTVRLSDRRELRARIIGTDEASDIAVLKVEVEDMPTIDFGSAADLRIGDVVFALGSPLGLEQTATMGIVSAMGRSNLGITAYDSLIQTDAAINPGNSGGAMINAYGELVGINTAILYRGTATFQGVGLSIPIDLARNVMNQILENGRVVRGFLGVNIDDLDSVMAQRFGLDTPRGAVVTNVQAGTPAAKAGLRDGDVILGVDGRGIDNMGELRLAISGRAPGDRVRLNLLRDGDRRTVTAKLIELSTDRSGAAPDRPEAPAPEPGGQPSWGFTLRELAEESREELGLDEDDSGLYITSVKQGSPADRGRLQEGDRILRLERKKVETLDEVSELLKGFDADTLLLLVQSGELTRYVVLER